MVPSEPMVGEDITLLLAAKVHFKVPSGLTAYRFCPTDPTYKVPSSPIAGEESTWVPASNLQSSVPFGLMA
jgi:hypothetical protein